MVIRLRDEVKDFIEVLRLYTITPIGGASRRLRTSLNALAEVALLEDEAINRSGEEMNKKEDEDEEA